MHLAFKLLNERLIDSYRHIVSFVLRVVFGFKARSSNLDIGAVLAVKAAKRAAYRHDFLYENRLSAAKFFVRKQAKHLKIVGFLGLKSFKLAFPYKI